MKRTLIAALALCLALAGCGAGASAPDAAGTPEAASQAAVASEGAGDTKAESPTGAAGDAGEVRIVDGYDNGRYYEIQSAPDGSGDCLLMVCDYAAATEAPLCNIPGCAHDTTDCPARFVQTTPLGFLAADGDQVFLCFNCGGLLTSGIPDVDARLQQAVTEDGPAVARIEVYNADGSGGRRLVEFPDLDGSDVGTLSLWAADDQFLYLTVRYENDPQVSDDSTFVWLAADRQTGETTTLWEGTEALYPQLTQGRRLYALEFTAENQTDAGGRVKCLDLDTGDWTDCFSWENEIGPDTPEGLPGAGNFLIPCKGCGGTELLRFDEFTGTLSAVDPDTGAETVLCDSLPAADPGTQMSWQGNVLETFYAITVWQGPDTPYRLFLVPKAGGDAVEVGLQEYVSGRGDQPIQLRDEWNGQFFAHVDYIETPITYLSKDGLPQEGTEIQDVYALLPVEDALAGQPNYRTIETWAGAYTGR